MKKFAAIIMALALCSLCGKAALAACMAIDSNLRITLPCVEYGGQHYQLILDHYPNSSDPTGWYWKYNFVPIIISTAAGRCATIDSNLNITGVCSIIYAGKQYLITLDYYPNSSDQLGLYWKLGSIQEVPVTVENVSGPTMECYNTSNYLDMINCVTGCGEDFNCILNCTSYFGGFSLALSLNNSTSSDVEFTIPSGTKLVPASGDFQPMLVLQEETLSVSPGFSIYCISTYCLALDLDVPGPENAYTEWNIVTQGCLLEIVNLTQGKDLDGQAVGRIQDIIWDCTENGSISSEDRDYLESL